MEGPRTTITCVTVVRMRSRKFFALYSVLYMRDVTAVADNSCLLTLVFWTVERASCKASRALQSRLPAEFSTSANEY